MGAFLDARQLAWTTNHGHSNGHDSGLGRRHRHCHGSLSSSSLPLASSLPSLSLLSTWSRSGERPKVRGERSEPHDLVKCYCFFIPQTALAVEGFLLSL